jgi:hypothetical protein
LIRENNIIHRTREEEKLMEKEICSYWEEEEEEKKRRGGIYPSCKISYLLIVVLCLYEKW